MKKENILKPVINKSNGQINFSIKKKSLPKEIKDKLPELKGIKINWGDFKFNNKKKGGIKNGL